jgi:vancomycin aglycone glucosyltransferase
VRILIAAAGSRGDTQPLLALAVELRAAGHHVELAAAPNFAAEAAAFGLPFHPVGIDQIEFIRDRERFRGLTPWKAVRVLQQALLPEIQSQFDVLVPLARGFDGIIGGGAQAGARSAAESAGIWYRYAAYTPQVMRSRHHPPLVIHWDLPAAFNGLAWALVSRAWRRLLGPSIDERRSRLGLPALADLIDYAFPPDHALLAFDPELMPLPPDVRAAQPPTGAWHLADPRPLDEPLLAFLEAGEPPLYVGFGSMPDPEPEATTRLLEETLDRVKRRAVVSAGWGGVAETLSGPHVHRVGPVNHGLLFPRCAAVVHHGGAGTTAAAARAGVPHVIIPHGFDQFAHARQIHRRGVGAAPLARTACSAKRLAARLERVLGDAGIRERAHALGRQIRSRVGTRVAIEQLTAGPLRP